jgi:hypothetical protein
MARRTRNTEQEWYDVFADMTVEDQAAALKVLGHEHHQAKRRAQQNMSASVAYRTAGTGGDIVDAEFKEVGEPE